MDDVQKIHHYLFSEIYEWAGEYRKVNISKSGDSFMPLQSFGTGIEFISKNMKINEIDIIIHDFDVSPLPGVKGIPVFSISKYTNLNVIFDYGFGILEIIGIAGLHLLSVMIGSALGIVIMTQDSPLELLQVRE